MSKGKTTKAESIKEQEWLVLAVYADMVENDNIDEMFDLIRHARIDPLPDPIAGILRHY